MKSLSENIKRYVILMPIVFLLLNAYYFEHASKQIQDAIMNEKRVEVENHVKMLAAVANQDANRHWINNKRNIVQAAEYIDSHPMVFAGAYKRENGSLKLISERNEETMFDPLRYSEFFSAIAKNESGRLELPFARDDEAQRTWYVYYHHMPLYAAPENRFLVVTSISDQSITTPIPLWESAGQWATMALTFLLNIILVVKIAKKTKRKGGGLK